MFRHERDEGRVTGRLVDESRQVSFRTYGGGGETMSTTRAAVLSWDGREIPLEFDSVQREDPASGAAYTLYQLWDDFGSWFITRDRYPVGTYRFRSPEERAQARLLAVEAVLVHSFRFVEGDWRVDAVRAAESTRADAPEWSADDFGYRTSADIHLSPDEVDAVRAAPGPAPPRRTSRAPAPLVARFPAVTPAGR
ncbi:hypothetical protein [Cellulomonas cellasea]|uniref:Uncharacterized protein n=1 Tax=Cellulomonas cellasea TaxID=43670 RepID=A0A7W4UFY4_9CELL|nr:hypothetical protein [Cellulomonas cellasea]MBB2923473.1 hypothetical protein [Cellulomonas cellasea]